MISRSVLKEAIKILMLSPVYFRLDLPARLALIREFSTQHQAVLHVRISGTR